MNIEDRSLINKLLADYKERGHATIETDAQVLALSRLLEGIPEECPAPIDVILFCPQCGEQHIDAPEPDTGWTNPPHRTHLCHGCGFKWRPANVHTNGVTSHDLSRAAHAAPTLPPGEAQT